MNYQTYIQLAESIINSTTPAPPYDDPLYLNYTRLNFSRMNRWYKTLHLNEELVATVKKIDSVQHWIIIAEPWCGDAAPIVPFLVRLAEQNALISYEIQLRDREPFLINSYLTNGTKSIPKLIVRNDEEKDLFTYGPRPKPAQQLVNKLKAEQVEFETLAVELQNWYNNDKGVELQNELLQLFMDLH